MVRAPFATWRPVPGPNDPPIRPIGVILHVDAGNAYSLYNWWLSPESGGIESHFHIAKDGYVEQYRDTEQEADANYKGNSFIRNGERVGFISVETQGFASGEWTAAQLARIRQILTWAHDTHGIPLIVVPSPYDPGIGYHVMWGAPGDWTPAVGKTCPGPKRIDQFYHDIVPWMEAQAMTIDRKTAVKPLDVLEGDVQKLRDSAVYTDHTNPGGLVFNDSLAAFLNRHYARVVRPEIARQVAAANKTLRTRLEDWVRDHVKTSIAAALAAGAGSAQIDYAEVVRRIGEVLAGG